MFNRGSADKKQDTLKALSEKEIQQRLYGAYLKKDSPAPNAGRPKAEQEQPYDDAARHGPAAAQKEIFARADMPPQEKGLAAVFKIITDNRRAVAAAVWMSAAAICLFFLLSFTVKRIIKFAAGTKKSAPAQIETVEKAPPPIEPPKTSRAAQGRPDEEALKPYTIQAGVYNKQADAEKIVSGLRKDGLDAYIVRTVSSRGRERFNIYVGEFATQADGEPALKSLKKYPEFEDSFLRRR